MKKKLLSVAMGAMLVRGFAEQDPERFVVATGEHPLGDAYSEGYAAFHDGIAYSDNPHKDGTPEAVGWATGWTHAGD